MKLITFAVPCYNSEAYMRKCVDSLLTGGDCVEIIIINDGSKDGTIDIANEYAAKYPDIVKVVDKENGGHGSGVNAGLKNASALYYKVVDSDDWLDEQALKQLLEKIEEHLSADTLPDLYITNFIYDHVSDGTQYVSSYEDKMPADEIIGWQKIKKFRLSRMLLMHSLLYKREKLLESGTVLPEHTFYVDNLFAYKPLPFMRTVCYLNINLYHYFIGRDDQSVNRKNFVKRYEQQILVMKCMTDSYTLAELKAMPKGLRKYMWHCLEVIMMNTIFFTCADDSPERRKALKEMWRHIKDKDKKLYRKLRSNSYATSVNYLTWKFRGFVMSKCYDFLCKKIKLG